VGTVSESFQLLASSVKDLCVLSIGRITDLDRTTEHVSMFFARQCTQVVELTRYKLQSRESTGYFLSQTIAVADLDLGGVLVGLQMSVTFL
jgi:hypothetical protein